MDNEEIKNKFNTIEDRGMTFHFMKTDLFDEPKTITKKQECESIIDFVTKQRDNKESRFTRDEIIQMMIMYANKKIDEK